MSLALLLTLYITLNLLLVMAYFGLKVIFYGHQKFSYQTQLKWHYALLSLVLLVSVLHPFIPAKQVFTPTAKVWTAKSIKSFSSDYEVLDKGGYIKIDVLGSEKTFDGSHVMNASALIFIPLFFIVSGLLLKDLYQLSLIRKSSYLYRHYKNVQILLNDKIQVPFSYMF